MADGIKKIKNKRYLVLLIFKKTYFPSLGSRTGVLKQFCPGRSNFVNIEFGVVWNCALVQLISFVNLVYFESGEI